MNLEDFGNKKYLLLKYLAARNETKTIYQEISLEIRVNRTTLAKMLQELRNQKYIQNPKRCIYILTPRGRDILRKFEGE